MAQTSGKSEQASAARAATKVAPAGRTDKESVWRFLPGSQDGRSHGSRLWNVALCIVIFGLALGFNLYRLGAPSIWFDEAFSVELARQPLPLIWHIIWGPEPNMELYYLLLHFWLGFTGFLGLLPTEFVVRFPSTIFAALSSVMVFLLGKRFIGTIAGIVGAVLYLLNDLQLVYAQQTRAYSLQLLLICVAWYALFVVLFQQTQQKRWWACFVAATTLALYSHLFSILILLSQLAAFGGLLFLPGPCRSRARQQIRPLLLSLLCTVILIIPMLLESLHGAKTGWLPVPNLRTAYEFFLTIYGASKFYLLVIAICCASGLFLAILPYLPRSERLQEFFALNEHAGTGKQTSYKQYLPLAFALVCWVVIPVVVSYVVSQGSTRLFSSRYLVVIVPPLCLLAGMGIAALRWRSIQLLVSLVVILVAVYYVPVYYRSAQVEDWNRAVPWLEQHYSTDDGLVCYDSDVEQGCQIAVEYYLQAYPSPAHFTSDSPGAFSWQNFGPADPHSSPEAATDPQALAAYGAKHPRISASSLCAVASE